MIREVKEQLVTMGLPVYESEVKNRLISTGHRPFDRLARKYDLETGVSFDHDLIQEYHMRPGACALFHLDGKASKEDAREALQAFANWLHIDRKPGIHSVIVTRYRGI